jgi:hypothetical protein
LWNGLRDNNGVKLNGGKVYTDAAGTSPVGANPKTTWDDHLKSNALANPIILDTEGRANVFLDGRYKLTIYDSDDNLIDTVDNAGYAIDGGPWVSINEYSDLTAAVAAIGAVTKTRLLIDAATTLTAHTTVTANITLDIQDGFPIPLGNFNLTIAKPSDYGDYYVFNHSGTGTVIFSIPTMVKPQWFGDGRGSTVLNAALAAITTSNHTLYMNTDLWTLDAAVTVPSTCGLTMEKGVIITLGAFDFTINGPRNLTLSKHFNENSTGAVSLGATYHTDSIPQWWGAVGDGSTDDSNAFDSAITALPAIGGRVLLMTPTVSYKASGMVIPNQVYVEGIVQETRIIPAADENVFTFDTTANVVRAGIKNIVIDGVATKGSYTSQSGIVIAPGATYFHDTIELRNVRVKDCGARGIDVVGVSTSQFVQRLTLEQVTAVDCVGSGLRITESVFETLCDMVFVGDCGDTTDAESNVVLGGGASGALQRITWNGGAIAQTLIATGNAMYISGVAQGVFTAVDFETAPVCINITGAFTKNVTLDTCNFGSNVGIDDCIKVVNGKNIQIRNCRSQGTAVTDGIDLSGLNSGQGNIYWDQQCDFSNATNPIVLPTAAEAIVSGAYKVRFRNGIPNRVEGEGPAADNLDNVFGLGGDTTDLNHGDLICLMAQNGAVRNITVRDNGASSGNLYLADAAAFVMSTNAHRIWLQWDGFRVGWYEMSRSDNTA